MLYVEKKPNIKTMKNEVKLEILLDGESVEVFMENLERVKNQLVLEAGSNPDAQKKLDYLEAIEKQVSGDCKIQFDTKQLDKEDKEDFTDQISSDIFGYYF